MIDWFLYVFAAIKAVILGAGMFFAIKWHYDREIKNGKKRGEMFSMASKLAVIFLLSLLGLGTITFILLNKLGL